MMEWETKLPISPGMYFVWGPGLGGVKAAEINYSGQVIFYGHPDSIVYPHSSGCAIAQNISHWYGPIKNPFGRNT